MDPFQQQFSVILHPGEANGGDITANVPAGKPAIIEHVSVCATGEGAPNADYFVVSSISGNTGNFDVPLVTHLAPSGAVGSHPCRAFGSAGTQFGGWIRGTDTTV
jgi:hypothetical protein